MTPSPSSPPASPTVDAAARPVSPASAGPRPAASAKRTTTAANEPPKASSGAATAAATAAGVTVAAGRWFSDAAFARLTEEVAAARVQTAAAEHQTALVRQQMEYEQQLAEQRAAEQTALGRLTERQAALRSTVVLGGTATAAVMGGSTALAFVAPADRRTAQAVMSLAGGAAALAGAMADRNSSTRGALLGAGGGLLLAAVIDLLRQSASKTLGGITGVTCRVTNLQYPIIETVAPRSSAGQAGLMQGDVVIRVDGVAVESVGIKAALQRMRGEIGTSVELVVLRDYYEITVVVVRAAI